MLGHSTREASIAWVKQNHGDQGLNRFSAESSLEELQVDIHRGIEVRCQDRHRMECVVE